VIIGDLVSAGKPEPFTMDRILGRDVLVFQYGIHFHFDSYTCAVRFLLIWVRLALYLSWTSAISYSILAH
jgi:hypothetical protein